MNYISILYLFYLPLLCPPLPTLFISVYPKGERGCVDLLTGVLMPFSVGRVLVRARLKALKEMLAGRVQVPQGVLFSLGELETGGGGKRR